MYNFKKNIISILLLGIFVFTPLVNINAQTQNSNCYSNSTKPCFSSISVSRNDKEATVWFSTIDNSVDEFQISVSLFKSDNTLFTGNSVQIKKSDIVAGITPSVKLGKNYNNTPDLDLSPNTFYLAKIVLIWTIDTGGVKNIYADNYFASFTTRQTGETVLMEDKNTTTIDYGSNTEKCEEYYTDPNKPTNAQTNPPGPQKKWWYNTHYQNLGIPQWSGPFSSKEDCQKIDQTLLLSPNNSLSSNKDWYYKPIKDADAKGPFSSITECEKERAKGNNYSKQCFQFYYPLAPLPGQEGRIDTTSSGDSDCPFGNYLNILIKLFIGICAVLAMIKIVLGGMQYMTSELSSGKEDGKNSITSAVFGLILALGAFAILNTINPELLKVCLNNLPKATVVISPTDTSTGSDQSLCISTTNPPSVNNVTGTTLNLNSSITNEYIPARNSLNLPIGIKLLITAQTAVEGFSATPTPGTKSYRTKNPGNIGNTDNGATKTFPTLVDGINAQKTIITNVANNSSVSYKLGSKPTCALGDEKYDGYLYQYLRIYSTGARMNNNYLSNIIGFFAANGKTITPKTTIAQIYALN